MKLPDLISMPTRLVKAIHATHEFNMGFKFSDLNR